MHSVIRLPPPMNSHYIIVVLCISPMGKLAVSGVKNTVLATGLSPLQDEGLVRERELMDTVTQLRTDD